MRRDAAAPARELGRNRFEGTGQSLLDDPEVKRLYLGGLTEPPGACMPEVRTGMFTLVVGRDLWKGNTFVGDSQPAPSSSARRKVNHASRHHRVVVGGIVPRGAPGVVRDLGSSPSPPAYPTASWPPRHESPGGGLIEIEAGDDFITTKDQTIITGVLSPGLLLNPLPVIEHVTVEIYRVFPLTS